MNHVSYIIRTLPYLSDYQAQETMFALARVSLAWHEDWREDWENSRERVKLSFKNQEIFQVLFEHGACIWGMKFAAPAESWAELGDMLYDHQEYMDWCVDNLPAAILGLMRL